MEDRRFLRDLAFSVENSLLAGIQTGLRIGWDGSLGLGQLSHVGRATAESDSFAFGPIRGLIAST